MREGLESISSKILGEVCPQDDMSSSSLPSYQSHPPEPQHPYYTPYLQSAYAYGVSVPVPIVPVYIQYPYHIIEEL